MFWQDLGFIGESILAMVFPNLCPGCAKVEASSAGDLCPECRDALRLQSGPQCFQCGRPVPGLAAQSARLCGACLKDPPLYHRARFGYLYEGALREMIIRFKYAAGLHLSRPLSSLLFEAFDRSYRAEEFDVIVPTPIHWKRLVQRGFNQALLLAERLSSHAGVSMDRDSVIKHRDTAPQVGLSWKQRMTNLKGAFRVAAPRALEGKRVLLVDDVATTGATLKEVAASVAKAGAARVDALVLAARTEGGGVEDGPDMELGSECSFGRSAQTGQLSNDSSPRGSRFSE